MTVSVSAIKMRTIALPAEHGGWGFLLEPILLGLLVAPSWAGLCLGVGVGGLFLARHPLKLVLADYRRGRRFARTPLAERFVLLYGAVAVLGLLLAVLLAGAAILLPMLLAAPFALVQLGYDYRNRSRAAVPEIAGPLALASVGSSIASAGGWPLAATLPLWALLAARSVPSVLYVRARLRLERGKAVSPRPAVLTHAAGLALAVVLWRTELAPLLAVFALGLLLGRAVVGLSARRVSVPAKVIGFREIAYGFFTVAAIAVGYWLGL